MNAPTRNSGPDEGEAPYVGLAYAAVQRIPTLVEGEESRSLAVAAEALAKRLSALAAVGGSVPVFLMSQRLRT